MPKKPKPEAVTNPPIGEILYSQPENSRYNISQFSDLLRGKLVVFMMCISASTKIAPSKTPRFFTVSADARDFSKIEVGQGNISIIRHKGSKPVKIKIKLIPKILRGFNGNAIYTLEDGTKLVANVIQISRSALMSSNVKSIGTRLMNLSEWPHAALFHFAKYQLSLSASDLGVLAKAGEGNVEAIEKIYKRFINARVHFIRDRLIKEELGIRQIPNIPSEFSYDIKDLLDPEVSLSIEEMIERKTLIIETIQDSIQIAGINWCRMHPRLQWFSLPNCAVLVDNSNNTVDIIEENPNIEHINSELFNTTHSLVFVNGSPLYIFARNYSGSTVGVTQVRIVLRNTKTWKYWMRPFNSDTFLKMVFDIRDIEALTGRQVAEVVDITSHSHVSYETVAVSDSVTTIACDSGLPNWGLEGYTEAYDNESEEEAEEPTEEPIDDIDLEDDF